MADCVFPTDIMLCILSRLPVKPLVRFKSVCKQWCKLFATPYFIKLHYRQFSDDPRNHYFMIYSHSKTHTMSLFRIYSDDEKPTNIDHPYPQIFLRMAFVGCCNGLICMGCPPRGQGIVLWNPALRLSKLVRLSEVGFGDSVMVSLGFGYDEETDDFKVVRIVCLQELSVGVEVYSTSSDSWKRIELGFQFRPLSTKNDAVFGGNPYWGAKMGENVSGIVWFDVKKMVFQRVPWLNLELAPLMEWKGSLAAIICNDQTKQTLHVSVLDKDQEVWNMNYVLGPSEMRMDRFLQCSKHGKIIGMCCHGKLFMFDPESGRVRMIQVDGADALSFQVHEYNESLVAVEGMRPVAAREEDEDEDEDEIVGPSGRFFKSYMQLRGGGHVW